MALLSYSSLLYLLLSYLSLVHALGNASALPKPVANKLQIPFLGDPIQHLGSSAGYYQLLHTKDARMFYFFFQSRNSPLDPVVIWLTGGPGCSGELALFYENGPYHINDDLSLAVNEFGWDMVSNIIFVDQPTGTGFSYSLDPSDIRTNEEGVSNDLYDFLQAFFTDHPWYILNDFYIIGESYAGHYIPALAARIQQGNRNMKGIAIGNGIPNPGVQRVADRDYALEMKLLNESQYNNLDENVTLCEHATKLCDAGGEDSCVDAFEVCNYILQSILRVNPGINFYDIRHKCEVKDDSCYNVSKIEGFLNLSYVRDAIGVGNVSFERCSKEVYDSMLGDIMRNFDRAIPALLEEGVKVLVYAGEFDLIGNWLGNWRWIHAMVWSGQVEFAAAASTPFCVDSEEVGQQKGYGPLKYVKMLGAGHMVPMDQPKASLQLIWSWMQG